MLLDHGLASDGIRPVSPDLVSLSDHVWMMVSSLMFVLDPTCELIEKDCIFMLDSVLFRFLSTCYLYDCNEFLDASLIDLIGLSHGLFLGLARLRGLNINGFSRLPYAHNFFLNACFY